MDRDQAVEQQAIMDVFSFRAKERKREHSPEVFIENKRPRTDTWPTESAQPLTIDEPPSIEQSLDSLAESDSFFKRLKKHFPEHATEDAMVQAMCDMRQSILSGSSFYKGVVSIAYGPYVERGIEGFLEYMENACTMDMPLHAWTLSTQYHYGAKIPFTGGSMYRVLSNIVDRQNAVQRSRWFSFAVSQILGRPSLRQSVCSDKSWKKLREILQKVWQSDESQKYFVTRGSGMRSRSFESDQFKHAWQYIECHWIEACESNAIGVMGNHESSDSTMIFGRFKRVLQDLE